MTNENTLTFITKEEYLAWRATWRADYAALAKRLREGDWRVSSDTATAMLETRTESKVRAGLLRDTGEATPAQIATGVKAVLAKREALRLASSEAARARAMAHKAAMKAKFAPKSIAA